MGGPRFFCSRARWCGALRFIRRHVLIADNFSQGLLWENNSWFGGSANIVDDTCHISSSRWGYSEISKSLNLTDNPDSSVGIVMRMRFSSPNNSTNNKIEVSFTNDDRRKTFLVFNRDKLIIDNSSGSDTTLISGLPQDEYFTVGIVFDLKNNKIAAKLKSNSDLNLVEISNWNYFPNSTKYDYFKKNEVYLRTLGNIDAYIDYISVQKLE